MSGPNFCEPCDFYHPRDYDCESSRRTERFSRFVLDSERDAYARGRADGYAERAREDDRSWAAMPPLRVAITDSYAELDALRYPDGRPGRHLRAVK